MKSDRIGWDQTGRQQTKWAGRMERDGVKVPVGRRNERWQST